MGEIHPKTCNDPSGQHEAVVTGSTVLVLAGYWCSASAPRSGNGLLQPPYNPPGGFLFRSNDSLPQVRFNSIFEIQFQFNFNSILIRLNRHICDQAGGYRNASGAVFHARGGTNP